MQKSHFLQAATALFVLCGIQPAARATYRADFFNTTRPPSIAFDKGSLTWTVRNQAIERVLHFDVKTGGLSTKVIRDLLHGREIRPQADAEGSLIFSAPILAPPAILDHWKLTDNAPPSEWTLAGYVDAAWQNAALPIRSPASGGTRWYRCLVPRGTILAKHAYSLLLDHMPFAKAEVYVDGDLIQTISPADRADQRIIQLDLPVITRAIGIKLITSTADAPLFNSMSIAEVGSAPPPLDLSKDWKYMIHSVNLGGEGSKVLTIGLDGLKSNEGFSFEVNYQIYPGQEPVVIKWFNFINHRSTQFLIQQALLDRLPLQSEKIKRVSNTATSVSNESTHEGFVAAVLSPTGDVHTAESNDSLIVGARPNLLMKTDKPSETPRELIGMIHGSANAGAFLLQLFEGQHIARATPASIPTIYSTQIGFGKDITESTCKLLIPTAASLGIKLFVLDNGWQTNSSSGSGLYGDWMTNRKPDKFPQGLLGISTLVRENGMRFGLWTTSSLLSNGSQAATEHPEWLIKRVNGVYQPGSEPSTMEACFTSGWEDNYSQSMLQLCRELTVDFLKVGGSPIQDGCIDLTHEHPMTHTQAAQVEHWGIFCEKMHKLSPQFLISHSTDGSYSDVSSEDLGWVSRKIDETLPASGIANILPRSESNRMELENIGQSRPTFTLSSIAPCHLSESGNEGLLDYLLSSAAACTCNLEISGRLDQITPAESALVAKWVKWNTENREWLAFSQAVQLSDGNTDGVLHIRPALQNRFGYLCVWNRSDSAVSTSAAFNAEDTLVKLDNAEFVNSIDGKIINVKWNGASLTVPVSMGSHSYQLIEIRQKR